MLQRAKCLLRPFKSPLAAVRSSRNVETKLATQYEDVKTTISLRPHRAQRTPCTLCLLCTGKIAAFTDNVRGHTKLYKLCTLCWRCSYVAVLFYSRLYFKTSLRTSMRSRPHTVTCSRQYLICFLLRQFRDTFN